MQRHHIADRRLVAHDEAVKGKLAIGYPDLVSVANTTINQTGQAVELVTLIMLAYLAISLTIAAIMGAFGQRIEVGDS